MPRCRLPHATGSLFHGGTGGEAGSVHRRCDELRRFLRGESVDCQFSSGEWSAFLECAKNRWESAEGLHKEYSAKLLKHPVPNRDIERTLHESAALIAYLHWETRSIGIWRQETGVLLVLRLCPEQGDMALYNVVPYEDIWDPEACGDMTDVRRLNP